MTKAWHSGHGAICTHWSGPASGGPPPITWTPADESFDIWYDHHDTSEMTLVSGKVDVLNDKGSQGADLSAPTSSDRPTYSAGVLGSYGATLWDKTNTWLRNSSVQLVRFNQAFTMYVVFALDASNRVGASYDDFFNPMAVTTSAAEGPRWAAGFNDSGASPFHIGNTVGANWGSHLCTTAITFDSNWHVMALTYAGSNPTSHSSWTLYYDETVCTLGNMGGIGVGANATSIGAPPNGNAVAGFKGYFLDQAMKLGTAHDAATVATMIANFKAYRGIS